MIAAAGAVIYRPSKGFLLLKKKQFWEFPKGRVEKKDADLLHTALREVSEETGLTDLKVAEGFLAHEQYLFHNEPKQVTYWLFTTQGNPVISTEHLGFAWCTEAEALQLLSYPTKKAVFNEAVAFLRDRKLLKHA
jgi:bis(5'-nucleosidyl)-tetraphosphatase